MEIQEKSNVTVHYVGTLENGDEFDNSYKKDSPLNFTVGEGKVLKAFEYSVIGKSKGDKLSVSLTADEAYGQVNENAISEIPKDDIPEDVTIVKDGFIRGKTQSGHEVVARVLDIKENSYILDLNHPLAGKDLKFDIEILEVN